MKDKERIVWSAKLGGSLMVQRRVDGHWIDWSSMDEGQFPEHDAAAKRSVRVGNAYRKAMELESRAEALRERAAVLWHKAATLRATK